MPTVTSWTACTPSIVKNLNAQAQILGYHDYSELSYVRMNRIGYGPAEIRKFRDQVASDVVPELKKVIELRCKRTGISHLTFSDLPVAFQDGNPLSHPPATMPGWPPPAPCTTS